jgi:hypothetical protein
MDLPGDETVSNGSNGAPYGAPYGASNGASSGRTGGGRFGPANKHGRGNPLARRQYELRQMLLEAVEPKDVQDIYNVLLKATLGGDVQAARLVLEYALGKPAQALELTGAEGSRLGGDLTLQAVIVSALAGFPEARLAVAAELRAIRDATAEAEGA